MHPVMSPDLEQQTRRQAERLREQLDTLGQAGSLAVDIGALQRVERGAAELRDALALLSGELRTHLASAELGFMPGPALDAFVPRHRQDWDKRLGTLAVAASAVQQWQGSDGRRAHRLFLIRGYIRGFAHLWRQHAEAPADPSPGSPFFEFACQWLDYADVRGDHEALIAGALESGWRRVDAP
jgi:hypothetical protein